MSIYFKILLALLLLAYLISPVDFIPDGLPILGWIDDTFLLGVLIYYLKNGRLPDFFKTGKGPLGNGAQFKKNGRQNSAYDSGSSRNSNAYSRTSSKKNGSKQNDSRQNNYDQNDPKKNNGRNTSQNSGPGAQAKNPYTILGVKPGATKKEIQAAYRKAAQEYHPDKVAHLGPELQELAAQKFIEIQEAYTRLKKTA